MRCAPIPASNPPICGSTTRRCAGCGGNSSPCWPWRGSLFPALAIPRKEEGLILERLKPALDETAACLERIAADPHAVADPRKTRDELLAARKTLGAAADDLAAEVGKAPLDPLANGLLILHRAGDMLHGLSMVMVAETATLRATRDAASGPLRPIAPAPYANTGAVMQGVRAALALLIISVFWAATTWSAGFWAVTGLGVMLIVLVNQEEPGRLGWPYLGSVVVAILAAYAALVFVLPRLEGFEALAIFLILALLPAGLMMGSPRYAIAGIGFGSFFAAEIGTGNVFQPDPQAYMNNALGLVFGMGVCLIVAAGLMPIDSAGARRRAWAAIIRALPVAARGERPERAVAGDIFAVLGGLLPRLDLDKPGDETLLRGALGAASTSMELWRLHDRKDDPGHAGARARGDRGLPRSSGGGFLASGRAPCEAARDCRRCGDRSAHGPHRTCGPAAGAGLASRPRGRARRGLAAFHRRSLRDRPAFPSALFRRSLGQA